MENLAWLSSLGLRCIRNEGNVIGVICDACNCQVVAIGIVVPLSHLLSLVSFFAATS